MGAGEGEEVEPGFLFFVCVRFLRCAGRNLCLLKICGNFESTGLHWLTWHQTIADFSWYSALLAVIFISQIFVLTFFVPFYINLKSPLVPCLFSMNK